MRRLLTAILFLSVLLQGHAGDWEKLPSLPVEAGNFICGTVENNLLIAGGITWTNEMKLFLNDVWIFQTKEKTWQKTGTLPRPIAYPSFGQTGRGIYFAGGSDGTNLQSDLCLLNSKGELKTLGTISQPFVYSGSAIAGSKLFVIAGASDPADLKTTTDTFYSIDLKTAETKALTPFPGGEWILPTATAIGDQIFVFTGAYRDEVNNSVINTDSAFLYSITSGSWKNLNRFPFTVRGLTSCALDERYILLAGGYTNEFTDDAFLYDTRTDVYLKTKPMPYRAMANFVRVGEYIYCLGGEDKMRHRSDLCYRIRWKELIAAAKRL